jgi:N-acetylglucosaminyl-diphospho-decaprenol L-rhamnosyltransferase
MPRLQVSPERSLQLGVAVVSHETRALLERCLESVTATDSWEVVVVDNGSTDGSRELIRNRFPAVRLIVNERNRGYGPAANQAIAACSAEAVLLLNGDTIVGPEVKAVLGRHLADHPRAAIVGPRLQNPNGTLQRSAYPFPSAPDTLLGESGLHLAVRRVPGLRDRFLRTWSHDTSRQVPWVLGAALAIRRSAFEAVGGFDEGFFMYGEEVDLCRRLTAAGFEIRYEPAATVIHVGGASTSQRSTVMQREYVVSTRRYLLRHESPRSAARLLRVLRAATAARLARDGVRLALSRDPSERVRQRRGLAAQWALVTERALWRL